MRKIIRLTESDLHNIIKETVKQCLQEDGATAGGTGSAATNGSGFFNGANNSNTSAAATFDVPFGVQRKKGYSPKGSSHSETNEVDMSDTLARHNGKGGSISIPKKRA